LWKVSQLEKGAAGAQWPHQQEQEDEDHRAACAIQWTWEARTLHGAALGRVFNEERIERGGLLDRCKLLGGNEPLLKA
jgi:hypothetical protein